MNPTNDCMMPPHHPPLSAWFGREPIDVSPITVTGFSGSRVFLVRRQSGERLVLKSFAAHTSPARAEWIHAVMQALRSGGLETVPRVFAASSGVDSAMRSRADTLVHDAAGRLWELVSFMPGSPREAPTAEEAGSAICGLAQLHAIAAGLPRAPAATEPSAGIEQRCRQAASMLATPWDQLDGHAAAAAVGDRLRHAIETFAGHGGAAALARVAARGAVHVTTQTVLRDVWSEHVLFDSAGRLAGFIDYHAVGRDTPATDLARLLGSWDVPHAGPDRPFAARWRGVLDAYERIRPLASGERRLIPWLHATGVIFGIDNWFRWLVTERRSFADMDRVLARIDKLLAQLPESLALVGSEAPGRD